jgi:hypothetical protein
MSIEEILIELSKTIDLGLFWMLIQVMGVFFSAYIITGILKQLSIYIRLRVSDIFSVRMPIEIDGFSGVIKEIRFTGIFVENKEGVIKFIPLNRWQYCDIRFPDLKTFLGDKDK